MSAVDAVLSQPDVARIGWVLVHFVWQGAAVALVLAIALLTLRRKAPNMRYLAACLALAAMAVAPAITMWATSPASSASASTIEPPVEPITLAPPEGETMPPVPATPPLAPPVGLAEPSDDPLPAPVAAAPPRPWPQRVLDALEGNLPWFVAAWFIGVVGLSARLLAGWLKVQRIRRTGVQDAATRFQEMAAALSRRLRLSKPVRLLESALARAPVVIGWLRPVILLPASAITNLTPQQLEAILAHELAHIRRYDYLVNLLQTVVETLLFYHPAVHWVSHRIRLEREHCCDDLAVAACGDSVTYARALTGIAEFHRAGPRIAAAASGGSLLARIRRLLGVPAHKESRAGRWLAGLIAIAAVAAVAGGLRMSTLADQAEAPADDNIEVETQTPSTVHPERFLVVDTEVERTVHPETCLVVDTEVETQRPSTVQPERFFVVIAEMRRLALPLSKLNAIVAAEKLEFAEGATKSGDATKHLHALMSAVKAPAMFDRLSEVGEVITSPYCRMENGKRQHLSLAMTRTHVGGHDFTVRDGKIALRPSLMPYTASEFSCELLPRVDPKGNTIACDLKVIAQAGELVVPLQGKASVTAPVVQKREVSFSTQVEDRGAILVVLPPAWQESKDSMDEIRIQVLLVKLTVAEEQERGGVPGDEYLKYRSFLEYLPERDNLRLPTTEELEKLKPLWPTVPPEENAAFYFAKAASLVKREGIPPGSTSADEPYAGDLQDFEGWLERNRAALTTMRWGLRFETCRFPVCMNKQSGQPQVALSLLSRLRHLGRTCVDAGFLEELKGRPGNAANWYGDCIRMGARIRQDSVHIEALVGIAICAIGQKHLDALVANARLSPQSLENVIARCRDAGTRAGEISRVWARETAMGNAIMEFNDELLSFHPFCVKARRYNEAVKKILAERPHVELLQQKVIRELFEKELKDYKNQAGVCPFQHWIEELGRMDVRLRATQIRAAIALHEKQHGGKLPDSLADL